MSTVRLKCPCGNSWDYPASEPVPDDLRTICPACLSDESPTVGSADPDETSTPHDPDRARVRGDGRDQSRRHGRDLQGPPDRHEPDRGAQGHQPGKARKSRRPGTVHGRGRAAGLLNHANIVTVHQADLDGPFPFVAMEYVPGIDLLRLVRKVGPLPVTDAVYYIRQAAEGLQHAFEQGLFHRDIKPSNLMVSPAPIGSPELRGKLPKVKILDMGLARVVTPEGKDCGSRSHATGCVPGDARLRRPRAGRGCAAGRHALGHLQSRRRPLLPSHRRSAVPRQDARREGAPGCHGAAIGARQAKGGAAVARRRRPQDARARPGRSLPDARRGGGRPRPHPPRREGARPARSAARLRAASRRSGTSRPTTARSAAWRSTPMGNSSSRPARTAGSGSGKPAANRRS